MERDKIDETIREIAAKHGVAIGRNDPILILHTMNDRLMRDSEAAQKEILEQFQSELEDIAHRWGNDAKDKAERTLNAALAASKEAMAKSMADGAKSITDSMLSNIESSMSQIITPIRWVAVMNMVAAGMAVVAAGIALLAATK